MTGCQIANVDVITNTSTIRSIIVIAEYTQLLSLAYSHLRDIRHQIVWNAIRILTNLTTLMRTDRIEISQQNYIPILICLLHIHQHLLQHRLGLTVWIGTMALRTFLGDRNDGRITINSSRT